MKKYILFLLIIFCIPKSFAKNYFQLSPSIVFNADYIFTTEIYLNLFYNIKDDLNISGYIKKSNTNGNILFDIVDNKLPVKPTGLKTDNDNYFYQLNISNKLYEKNTHKIFFTISWYDSMKYDKSLQYTYADIYNYLRFKLDYVRTFNNQDYNFFIQFSNTFNGIKNNINVGLNTKYKINDNNTIFLQYDYYKDIKKEDKVNFSHSYYIYPWFDTDYLMYEANNLSIIDTINLDDIIKFDIFVKYSFVKNFGNNYNFGLSYYF